MSEDEWVFIPLIEFLDNPDAFKVSDKQLELEMKIIQKLKEIEKERKAKDTESEREAIDKEISEKGEISVEKTEEIIIKERIKKMRPERNWKEIAESLGITVETLRTKRRKYNFYE